MQLAWLTGYPASTCWKVLKRHGVCRRRHTARPQSTRRYEWAEPGALLHIDAIRGSTGPAIGRTAVVPSRTAAANAGKTVVIGAVDDHTRPAWWLRDQPPIPSHPR
jgi:hypothetical protein